VGVCGPCKHVYIVRQHQCTVNVRVNECCLLSTPGSKFQANNIMLLLVKNIYLIGHPAT